VFTGTRHWFLFWARSIQSKTSHPIPLTFPSHVCYMPLLSHPPWFDHVKNIWWCINVMKLLITQSFSTFCHFLILVQNILLSTLFPDTLNLCSSLSVRYQVSHPHKTTSKIGRDVHISGWAHTERYCSIQCFTSLWTDELCNNLSTFRGRAYTTYCLMFIRNHTEWILCPLNRRTAIIQVLQPRAPSI